MCGKCYFSRRGCFQIGIWAFSVRVPPNASIFQLNVQKAKKKIIIRKATWCVTLRLFWCFDHAAIQTKQLKFVFKWFWYLNKLWIMSTWCQKYGFIHIIEKLPFLTPFPTRWPREEGVQRRAAKCRMGSPPSLFAHSGWRMTGVGDAPLFGGFRCFWSCWGRSWSEAAAFTG